MAIFFCDLVLGACFAFLACALASIGDTSGIFLAVLCGLITAKHWVVAGFELAILMAERRSRE